MGSRGGNPGLKSAQGFLRGYCLERWHPWSPIRDAPLMTASLILPTSHDPPHTVWRSVEDRQHNRLAEFKRD